MNSSPTSQMGLLAPPAEVALLPSISSCRALARLKSDTLHWKCSFTSRLGDLTAGRRGGAGNGVVR